MRAYAGQGDFSPRHDLRERCQAVIDEVSVAGCDYPQQSTARLTIFCYARSPHIPGGLQMQMPFWSGFGRCGIRRQGLLQRMLTGQLARQLRPTQKLSSYRTGVSIVVCACSEHSRRKAAP